jgi:hypothetical protein
MFGSHAVVRLRAAFDRSGIRADRRRPASPGDRETPPPVRCSESRDARTRAHAVAIALVTVQIAWEL